MLGSGDGGTKILIRVPVCGGAGVFGVGLKMHMLYSMELCWDGGTKTLIASPYVGALVWD